MSDDLGHLDFPVDVDQLRSDAGIALALARTIMERLRAGDLPAVERIGKLFTIVSPDWSPSFGPPEPWDPSRHAVGVIVGPNGQPLCTVDSAILTRP